MCENNIPGIQASNVCCPASCGTCGGPGCTGRDGGPNFSGKEACCGGGVRSLDRDCSVTGSAPCVFPEGASTEPWAGNVVLARHKYLSVGALPSFRSSSLGDMSNANSDASLSVYVCTRHACKIETHPLCPNHCHFTRRSRQIVFLLVE